MRKAFDDNVPKLKPRLKTAVVVVSESAPETDDEGIPFVTTVSPHKTVIPAPVKESVPEPEPVVPAPVSNDDPSPVAVADISPEPIVVDEVPDENNTEITDGKEPAHQPEPSKEPSDTTVIPTVSTTPVIPILDIESRRERLEKVKRKVAEAVRTGMRIESITEDPAQAAESILGLVSDLETQLSRTRDLEKALRIDLAEVKAELARTVTEGRVTDERLGQSEVQLEEKRKVLEEMLVEMSALEEERDHAVRRVQTLTAQDEERQKQLDDLEGRYVDLEKVLYEGKAEEERLLKELDECMTENAQLRVVLSEVTQERDNLVKHVEQLIRERDEQVEAKRALDRVHQALAQARARLRS